MKLLVVTAFHSGDIDAAVRLYDWIKELGGIDNDVLLVHDPQDDRFKCNRVLLAAKRAAKNVTLITTPGTHKKEWPHGPNAAFLSASKWALDNKRNFLWLETDCVPTKRGWLGGLEREYAICGNKYLGGIVTCKPPLPPKVMYGVAVYHHTVCEIAEKALAKHPGTAFDVAMSPDVTSIAASSKHMQFSAKQSNKPATLSNGVVLFHPDKTGSLTELLRGSVVSEKDEVHHVPSKYILRKVKQKEVKIDRPCFVQLGRIGDILNVLPIARYWSSICYHEKMPMLVHSDYVNVLSRVGYVHQLQWTTDLNDVDGAVEYAKTLYNKLYVCQLFSNKGLKQPVLGNYNLDQWYNCGEHEQFGMYPLEIDQRNFALEDEWFASKRKTDNPLVCYNLDGNSSPFKHRDEMLNMLKTKFGDCELWDLGAMRTPYYTDQLIALDRCSALLTIDTSTLHLAQASHCPFVALLSDTHGNGWSATKSRRRPRHATPYGHALEDINAITKALEDSIASSSAKPRKVWHLVPRRQCDDQRVSRAETQWNRLYANGILTPLHIWHTHRDAHSTINDKRMLPYLRDVLNHALDVCHANDVVIFTNDDVAMTKRCVEDVLWKLKYTNIVTCGRVDVESKIGDGFEKMNGNRHLGRDLVAFNASYLRKTIKTVPDFILGASEWDLVIASMARNLFGIVTTCDNVGFVFPECELCPGTLFHEHHSPYWSTRANIESSPSQKHNRLLAEQWFRHNARELRLHWFGNS